jgi:DNA-binding MarR family transcriptional regulator
VGAKRANGNGTYLQELSDELSALVEALTRYAEEKRQRREAAARERITAAQLQAVLAARYWRSEKLGLELAHPGWSLLLELFRASLEQRRVRLARLATDAHVPVPTAIRWVDRFVSAGLVRREADAERAGVVRIALTAAGAEAMEDYFVAVQLGWAEADASE